MRFHGSRVSFGSTLEICSKQTAVCVFADGYFSEPLLRGRFLTHNAFLTFVYPPDNLLPSPSASPSVRMRIAFPTFGFKDNQIQN